jgi:thiol-disulfide isomerase/thioredoxin
MARARPALLTVALSGAAVLGYLAYRALSAPHETVPAEPGPDDTPVVEQLTEKLPEFSLADLQGNPKSIQSWPGKPLIINFWATWCGPCLREIPMLKDFQTAHGNDIQVVGIAVDRHDPVVGFAAKMQFNYPILVGENEAWAAAAQFGVDFYALPFTVFTAGDGTVLGVHTGELAPEHLENLTAALADLDAGAITASQARERLAGLL